jgi:hypothetical protein
MGVRSSLHAALSSYQQQQAGGGMHIARSKLLDDHVFHGTTTCAFVFDQGILVAVDSRASMGKIYRLSTWLEATSAQSIPPTPTHFRELHWLQRHGKGAARQSAYFGNHGGRGSGLCILDSAFGDAGKYAGLWYSHRSLCFKR